MRRLARLLRGTFLIALLCAGCLAALTLVTARPSDPSLYPPADKPTSVSVHVVDHGYHAALILPVAQLSKAASETGVASIIALIQRFSDHEWVEIGWGDDNFYRNVPNASLSNAPHVLRALLLPGNRSVLHVVGFSGAPAAAFPGSSHVPLRLGENGFRRLTESVGATFELEGGAIVDAGAGLYGPSRFFAANGTYSLFRLCNHWVGEMLHAAGLPYMPVPSTLSFGLRLGLSWRGLS